MRCHNPPRPLGGKSSANEFALVWTIELNSSLWRTSWFLLVWWISSTVRAAQWSEPLTCGPTLVSILIYLLLYSTVLLCLQLLGIFSFGTLRSALLSHFLSLLRIIQYGPHLSITCRLFSLCFCEWERMVRRHRWCECLLGEHEDLNSDPQHLV